MDALAGDTTDTGLNIVMNIVHPDNIHITHMHTTHNMFFNSCEVFIQKGMRFWTQPLSFDNSEAFTDNVL